MLSQVATAVSHPNKALVIYWGKANKNLFLPTRSSLSMTLEGLKQKLDYTVTIRLSENLERDKVYICGKEVKDSTREEFIRHMDILRNYAGLKERVEISARSTFPVGSGLAGSAARSSAMATAFLGLFGEDIDRKTASIYARRGSGSGCRSIYGGFVKWEKGHSNSTSYAKQLYDETHWDLRDLIAVVNPSMKKVPSRDGMELSLKTCNPKLYDVFTEVAKSHIREITKAISRKDIALLGDYYERDNFYFRAVCMRTKPKLDYWSEATQNVFSTINNLRQEGAHAYAGTDAGPNVHVFTLPKYVEKVRKSLKNTGCVLDIIHCKPGGASRLIKEHLL